MSGGTETNAAGGETAEARTDEAAQGMRATANCQAQVVAEETLVHLVIREDIYLDALHTKGELRLSATDLRKVVSTQKVFAQTFTVIATGQDMLFTVTLSDSAGGNRTSNTIRIKHP